MELYTIWLLCELASCTAATVLTIPMSLIGYGLGMTLQGICLVVGGFWVAAIAWPVLFMIALFLTA
jgi:type IV secretory pathway VirB3-like protein